MRTPNSVAMASAKALRRWYGTSVVANTNGQYRCHRWYMLALNAAPVLALAPGEEEGVAGAHGMRHRRDLGGGIFSLAD
jgi:hypothetical protein